MKVFELYSGIGGMHFALQESGVKAEVVCAVDINTTANLVYKINFPSTTLLQRNIQNLSVTDFNDVEIILMSPPCQPHTRNGLKKDKSDERSTSLLHIISILPYLTSIKYILVENVKGFELSEIRNELVQVLNDSNFIFQEFLLTPREFAIPNSRLRYYLLAKRKPLNFCFQGEKKIMDNLPVFRSDVESGMKDIRNKYISCCDEQSSCYPIKLILEKGAENKVPDKLLKKYWKIFDIVTNESTHCCCFTKGYSHFIEGTGSVYSPKSSSEISQIFKKIEKHNYDSNEVTELLKSLELRYFTPREILNLMSFPEKFKFPTELSNKQKYRLLGNSINVHVVAILIRILVS